MLAVLDKLVFVLHAALIAFVLAGWAWRGTRRLHLVVTGLVAFSWLVLGAHYGAGYCLLTDWHLRVRRAMGRADAGSTYLQLLAGKGLGLPLSREASDWLGGVVFFLMLVAAGGAWGRAATPGALAAARTIAEGGEGGHDDRVSSSEG